ncbi:MAG: PVC-type heme-binding CxxCH protein [Gemmataceae bacterium]
MRFLSALALAFALAGAAQAQLPPDKALATMQVAPGFQVEQFAAEPMLMNPTSIDIDHKGRVWVAEAVNYRRVGFNRPIIRKEGDRIVVLIDTDGDGKADESKVFYQGKDLYGPLSVCVIPSPGRKSGEFSYRVLVAQSPDILEFKDEDGDLKADGPPTKFLTGFGGFDHDHGVHGLNIGPDGKLYFTVGDSGVTGLQSRDKKGPVFKSNTTTIQKGTVWRCDLDGNNVELIAHNFRNNYECCVDSFGEIWLSDNDDDGNQQTRICFVMPGGNYGYGPRGQGESHWHEEQPGIVHKVLRTGFGSPTGITFYEGNLLPEKYRGQLLHTDAGPREVRAFFRKPKGAGYELDKEVLLTSSETWFRPSDVCVAPDGSIFVADWYDKNVGGHAMNDPQDGRIYRLTPKGHKGYTVPEVKLDTKDGVLAALGSPCLATRWMGHHHISSMKWKQFVADGILGDAIKSRSPVLHARVFWAEGGMAELTGKGNAINSIMKLNEGEAERMLPTAFRIDGVQHGLSPRIESPWLLGKSVPSLDAMARRELLLGHRDSAAALLKANFYTLAKLYDGQDHFYRAALNIACGTDPKRRDEILADFDKHFPEWNDKVADLVWELRPKSVLPRLGKMLSDAKLTDKQKARVLDIIVAYDDASAGAAMLDVLKADAPAEVKARAVDQLRLFLPTKWKTLQGSKELAAAIDDLLKSSPTTGLQLIAAANAVDRVPSIGEWVGGKDVPEATRREAVRTLGKLKSKASAELLAAAVNLYMDAGLQAEAIRALGSHVTGQPKDEASVIALLVLQKQLASKENGGAPQLAAVESLAGSRAGTDLLLKLKEEGKFPKEADAAAGRFLRNSPFEVQRAKAQRLFPAPGKLNPKNLPALAVLAKRDGDAARGKLVWDASFNGTAQCAKCHTVRGVGGQVGPDLSMIGKKGGKENLLESILFPSKAIADQYVQAIVLTTADVTVTGLVVADTPQALTLRDANGKDVVIPKADIASQKKATTSIMPEDIVAGLSEDELIDLVAYLTTLQTAALTPGEFKIAGPYPGTSMLDALNKDHGPEAGTREENWKTIRADAKGYFDLAAFHGDKGKNSASYMMTMIDSPADQDADVLLGPDDGAKLFVNGKEVFKSEETVAATPGKHKVAIKLKKGSNAILLKVANGDNPHGFYFTVLSKEELKIVK